MAKMSNREKMARRQAKVKSDPELYKLHLEKDRLRKDKKRFEMKENMSEAEWQEHRLKENLRIRKLRNSKPRSKPNAVKSKSGPPFKSPRQRERH